MMKQLKALFVILIMSLLVSCGGKEDRKAAYLEKAQESIDAGDLDKARIELKNVLQIDPKDDRAYYKIGDVFERKQDYRKAYSHYSKAAELKPESDLYQAKLGKYLLMLANNIEMAKEKLALVKSIDKDSLPGLLLEAGIAATEKRKEEALAISQDIRKRDPSNIENVIFMVSLLNADKKYDESISVLKETASHYDNNTTLSLQLANLYVLTEQNDEAERLLKELINEDEGNYRYDVNLATFYLRTKQNNKAVDVLIAAIKKDPADLDRRIQLINFIQETEGVESAISVANDQVEEEPGEGLLKLKIAQLQIIDKNIAGAVVTLKEIIQLYPDEQVAIKSRLALAEQSVASGDVEAAEVYINDAYRIVPNDADVNLLKAKIDLHNKNIEQAIISLRTVVKDNPENIQAYILLSMAHKSNGENDQAKDVLARAHENNRGNLEGLLTLARFHMKSRSLTEAERVIDDYMRINPNEYESLSIKAALLNATKRSIEAIDIAAKLVELYPEKINGYIQSAPGLVENGELKKAIAVVENGVAKTEPNRAMYTLLIKLMIIDKNMSGAVSVAQQAIDKMRDPDSYQLLAKVYFDNGKKDMAFKVLDDGLLEHPESEALYIAVISLYAQSSMQDKILPYLKTAVVKANPNTRLQMMLAAIYERSGDVSKAIDVYRGIVQKEPTNLLATNNLAASLVDNMSSKASIDEALSLVQKLKEAKRADVKDTVAWVYYRAGKHGMAADILKEVVVKEPDNQIYNYHYGMVLNAQGDTEKSRMYLERAVEGNKKFKGIEEAKALLNALSS